MSSKQKGSVSWFVVVALILVAVASIVLYGSKQFMISQQSPVSEDISLVDSSSEKESGNISNNQESSGNAIQDQDIEKSNNQNSGAIDTKNSNDSRSSNGKSIQDSNDDTNSKSTNADNQSKKDNVNTESSNLPTTGPEESSVVFAICGLVFIAVSYVRSRRII